jgi:hypothetical protein
MQVDPHAVSVPMQAHIPPAQCCPAAQAWPHDPQLALSVVRSMHGPFVAHMVMTSVPFGSQTQVLLVQLAPRGQTLVHDPQWLLSLVVLMHVIVLLTTHIVVAPVHVQTPGGWQLTPDGHAVPQVLQFSGS